MGKSRKKRLFPFVPRLVWPNTTRREHYPTRMLSTVILPALRTAVNRPFAPRSPALSSRECGCIGAEGALCRRGQWRLPVIYRRDVTQPPRMRRYRCGNTHRPIHERLQMPHKKPDLPTKICSVCQRPFMWRKKWERCWDQVRYCSEKCRRAKESG